MGGNPSSRDNVEKDFQQLYECANFLRKPSESTCARACRGDIGPLGQFNRQAIVTEEDDLRCVLWGLKPLALVHRLDKDAAACVLASGGVAALDSGASIRQSVTATKPGAALVFLAPNKALAEAAMPLLHTIGAWKTSRAEAKAKRPNGRAITEIQAHIGLGALLGYPMADLQGLHMALCKQNHGVVCGSFYRDAMAVFDTLARLVPEHAARWRRELGCLHMRGMRTAMHTLGLHSSIHNSAS